MNAADRRHLVEVVIGAAPIDLKAADGCVVGATSTPRGGGAAVGRNRHPALCESPLTVVL